MIKRGRPVMMHAALEDLMLVPSDLPAATARVYSYRVEIANDLLDEQGQLLDQLITFTFETLGACHLDIRIVSYDYARDEPPPGSYRISLPLVVS
jgi:hypothetical protein